MRDDLPGVIVPLRGRTHNGNGTGPPGTSVGQWEGDKDRMSSLSYLIKSIIPQQGVGLLLGKPSMGKSYMLLEMIQSVILGTDFAGQQIMRPGAALLLAAEGAQVIRPRWEAIRKAKIAPYFEQLGEPMKKLPFKWDSEVLPLTGKDAEARMMAYCKQMQIELSERQHDCDLSIVGIDTFSAASLFKDQNDAAEVQPVMNMLSRVSSNIRAPIALVDHFGKDETRGARGTSAKEASADFILAILGDKAQNGTLSNLRLVVQKLRGGATGREIPFEMVEVTLGIDDDGDPIKEMVIKWDGVTLSKRASPGRPNFGVQRICEALDDVLLSRGVVTQVFPDAKPVRAVEEPWVKEEFMRRYPPVAEDGEAPRLKAARKAWERALQHPSANGRLAVCAIGGRTLMWRGNIDKPKHNGGGHA